MRKSVIVRESSLEIDTSLAVATLGLRTKLLLREPPLQPPPHSNDSIFPRPCEFRQCEKRRESFKVILNLRVIFISQGYF